MEPSLRANGTALTQNDITRWVRVRCLLRHVQFTNHKSQIANHK
jgi:hypothetical protein